MHNQKISIVSINPDTINLSGHFCFYDFQLVEMCHKLGIPFYSFCWQNTPEEIIQKCDRFIPTFRDHSWSIGNRGISGPPTTVIENFSREFNTGLQKFMKRGYQNILIYMYTGSLEYAEVLSEIIIRQNNVVANINLFWLPFVDITSSQFKKRWYTFLKLANRSSKIFLTVTTPEIQKRIFNIFGIKIDVAPHPSTLISDRDFFEIRKQNFSIQSLNEIKNKNKVNILFPGRAGTENRIKDKGYLLSLDIVKSLFSKRNKLFYEIIMRKPTSGNFEAQQATQQVTRLANFFSDEVSINELIKLMNSSDIIVLPYSREAFSCRTSGIFTDAIYLGKPVVALKGTWMANRIEELGCGVIAESSNSESFVKAIQVAIENYSLYRKNSVMAGARWFQCNSWMSLLSSILQA